MHQRFLRGGDFRNALIAGGDGTDFDGNDGSGRKRRRWHNGEVEASAWASFQAEGAGR
jgi:hypothetical protein